MMERKRYGGEKEIWWREIAMMERKRYDGEKDV